MWGGAGVDADDDRLPRGGRSAHHRSESAYSSSSETESIADGDSSPTQYSPLASPTSSSPSPPRPSPLSDFLSRQLHQPVMHSLKTWINGEESLPPRQAPERDPEERWGPTLWAWCLGADEDSWVTESLSAAEDEESRQQRLKLCRGEMQETIGERSNGRVSKRCLGVEVRRRKAGVNSSKPQAPAKEDSVGEHHHGANFLDEHHWRVGTGVNEVSAAGPCTPCCDSLSGRHHPAQDNALDPDHLAPLVLERSSTGRPAEELFMKGTSADEGPRKKARLQSNVQESGVLQDREEGKGRRCIGESKGEVHVVRAATWQQKFASFAVRAFSSLWMVAGFAFLAYLGHVYMWALVVTLQVMMVNEVLSLARRQLNHSRDAVFPHLLDWHFVVTAMVYMYGGLLREQLLATAAGDCCPWVQAALLFFVWNHNFICYALYLAGFVAFVVLLREEHYRTQFAHLAWNHLVVFLLVLQSSFFAPNIFQGLIWFLLPCSLVILNDCAAYMFGFFLGRTPLIRLSPKKTWEGYLGGALTTTIGAFLLAGFLQRYQWLICPRMDLSLGSLHCTPDSMFQPQPLLLPNGPVFSPWAHEWKISPFQIHAIILGAFASTLAPYGGFFASGLKRALKVKDFGNLIPGHGGVTDRMDCQILMALFAYMYLQTFARPSRSNIVGLSLQ